MEHKKELTKDHGLNNNNCVRSFEEYKKMLYTGIGNMCICGHTKNYHFRGEFYCVEKTNWFTHCKCRFFIKEEEGDSE